MPLVTAGVTALALLGAPGLATYTTSVKTAFVSPNFTALSLNGVSGRWFEPVDKSVSALFTFEVSDTASLSGTESPIDRNEIATYDAASIQLSAESATLLNRYAVSDTGNISISETISLVTAGIFTLSASDTASISITEARALVVSLSVTDTASVSLSGEVATQTAAGVSLSSTDTASISIQDFASVTIFSGVLAVSVSDTASIRLSGELAEVELGKRINAIGFAGFSPEINFQVI